MPLPGLVLLGFLIVGSLLWLNTVAGIFMQQARPGGSPLGQWSWGYEHQILNTSWDLTPITTMKQLHMQLRDPDNGSKSIGDTILLWQSLEGNLMINHGTHGSCLWHSLLHLKWLQVDRSFEVTNVHQFKDPEFMAATKEILREFVLDLQESWHEIRNDPEWHLHLHFLDLRVASKDSISRFHSCHSCHSCHSWRVASFPRIWTKTIASRWTGVRCWDQFEALKSKLYGRFPQQKLGVQQNHGFSNQKWAIAGILLLFLGYPHWNRSPQMIWTPPWNDHDLRVFSPKDLLGSDAPFGTPIGSWNTQHG